MLNALGRERLNRADPRLRGRVTWLPLTGHTVNMGDGGGQLPRVGNAFTPAHLAGIGLTVPGGGSSAALSDIRADAMGISGAARRTLFLEATIPDTNVRCDFLCIGNSVTRQDFSFVNSNFRTVKANFWGGDLEWQFSATPGGFTFVLRLVITYDGNTGIVARHRAMRIGDGVWEAISQQSYTLGGTLATPASAVVSTNYWNAAGSSSGTSGARLHYAGYVADTVWRSTEIDAFLLDPAPLWTASRPIIVAPAPAGGGEVNLSGGATFDAITGAGNATVIVAASGGATLGATTGAGNATVVVAASGGATLAPVTGAGNATATVALSGGATLDPVTGDGLVYGTRELTGGATLDAATSAGALVTQFRGGAADDDAEEYFRRLERRQRARREPRIAPPDLPAIVPPEAKAVPAPPPRDVAPALAALIEAATLPPLVIAPRKPAIAPAWDDEDDEELLLLL